MPGETLLQSNSRFQPTVMAPESPFNDVPADHSSSANSEILDALKGMQEGVESKFSTIADKLETVCDRLNVLESRQKSMEEEIRASSSSATSCSPSALIPGKRIRRTPPALQVRCNNTVFRMVHYLLFSYSEQDQGDTFSF